ncbi:MAG: hypothetical protein AAF196_07400 [Planctomycetota bacterium]
MLATFASLALLAPSMQDPGGPQPIAPMVEAVHQEIDVERDVEATVRRLRRTRDGRVKGLPTPQLVKDLRDAGPGALDLVESRLTVPEQPYDRMVVAFTGLRQAWGLRGRPARVERRVDVDSLKDAVGEAFAEFQKAAGSGDRLDVDSARLHSAIERIQNSTENLGELSREQRKELSERLSRFRFLEQGPLIDAAELIIRTAIELDRPELIDSLKRMRTREPRQTQNDVEGDVLIDEDIPGGRFVVGGFGRNVYDCTQFALILDPGGDDYYRGPAGGAGGEDLLTRIRVVVDLDGDDVYEGGNDSLGSATFGIGIIVDTKGDDTYTGEKRCGGFGIGGVGALVDVRGNDTYEFGNQSFGTGFGGTGLFMDLEGNDIQKSGVQSFGVGLPAGIGFFLDSQGDDERETGRVKKQVAEPPEGRTSTMEREEVSVSFGVGVGVLPLLSGGIGAFLDVDGDDTYRSAGLSFGCGLRGGAGVFRDLSGDDDYSLLDAGLGLGYANGIGVFSDSEGNDRYAGRRLILGSASLDGMGLFLDRAGDDSYLATRPSFGLAQEGALAFAIDLSGSDRYQLTGREANWRFVVDQEPLGLAVGLAMDLGPGEDRFPTNPAVVEITEGLQVLRSGEGNFELVHAIVDRESM